jgi:hypothetical protein
MHGKGLSHLEHVYADHDQDYQPWKLMKIHPKKTLSFDIDWPGVELRLYWKRMMVVEAKNWRLKRELIKSW